MKKREEWGTRMGFILAAVGSAIGLGNIWRFPYQVYDNRGGVFLIPYFFALLTAGIPLLILEFGLGHKLRGAAPSVFARLTRLHKSNTSWEWLGWFQTLLSFVISTYYTVIIGWTIGYFFLSFFSSGHSGWGGETGAFFDTFLGAADKNASLINFTPWIPALTLLVWGICYIILIGGIKRGIELANKIFMPILIILVLFITIRALFLQGAANGLDTLFKPDFSGITFKEFMKISVAAYGQIFFSLSVGFAVMISYSSYLPKRSDIVNNAFITGLLNCGFSMISGIMIFSILGNMAFNSGVEVNEVAQEGAGLAFITIPAALNSLPGITGRIIGPLFFVALTFAGFSSAVSILEATVAAITDKFHLSRLKAATGVVIAGFCCSILYSSKLGVSALSTADNFVNQIGILLAGIAEIALLAWFFKLKLIRDHVNLTSDFKAGLWWTICIAIITPLALITIMIMNIASSLSNSASIFNLGLSQWLAQIDRGDLLLTLFFGWLMIFSLVISSLILQRLRGGEYHLTGHELDFEEKIEEEKK